MRGEAYDFIILLGGITGFMNVVYVKETRNRADFVFKILDIYWGEISKVRTIFVKPNIVSYEGYPTTTHPEVLDALLSRLVGKEVVVGDGPAFDAGNSRKIVENHPLKKVCNRFSVPLLDLNSGEMTGVRSPRGYSFKISKAPFNFEYFISLPVLKVHKVCSVTGALKNQFGLLSKWDRIKMHIRIKNIDKGIAELNSIIKPDLIIMDAVETLVNAQETRHGGRKVKLGYMLAGKDPVAIDIAGLQLLSRVEPKLHGKKPGDIRHINYAIQIGVGSREFTLRDINQV